MSTNKLTYLHTLFAFSDLGLCLVCVLVGGRLRRSPSERWQALQDPQPLSCCESEICFLEYRERKESTWWACWVGCVLLVGECDLMRYCPRLLRWKQSRVLSQAQAHLILGRCQPLRWDWKGPKSPWRPGMKEDCRCVRSKVNCVEAPMPIRRGKWVKWLKGGF